MKVGLLNTPGGRYGLYWETFLSELGAEMVRPQLDAAQSFALGQQSLPDAPATVQRTLGNILAMPADLVVVVQPSAVPQDAWGSALTELLPRRISGLPPLLSVPDTRQELESAATELGQNLTHNAAQVRLALEKARPLTRPKRQEEAPLQVGSRVTVAVIGLGQVTEDDFLAQPLRGKLAEYGLHPVYAAHLSAEQLEERGARGQDFRGRPLLAGERDLFGAQSLLEGKSAVRGLLYVSAARDAATQSVQLRLSEKAHKPTLQISLDPSGTDWSALEAFARQLGADLES